METLKLGFSSIMYDGSAKDYETNVSETKEMAKIAHFFGATVEGEIGHVGETATADNANSDMYTTVEETCDYILKTEIDACAVLIETAHGAYVKTPKLDFVRLSEICSAVNVPLVLHGGSGLGDDDFKNSIKNGIAKVNIFTDLCTAGAEASRLAAEQGMGYLEMRSMRVESIKKAVIEKIKLFGSAEKGK